MMIVSDGMCFDMLCSCCVIRSLLAGFGILECELGLSMASEIDKSEQMLVR